MTGADDIRRAAEEAEPAGGAPADDTLDRELFHYDRNDYGNGQRLLKRHGRKLLYVTGVGWYAWDGKRWNGERGGHIAQTFAHQTALAIRNSEIPAYRTEAKEQGKDAELVAKICDSHRKFAIQSGNSNKVKNMLAEAVPYLERPHALLDAKPHLFNTRTCTLNLSGPDVSTRRHVPSDLITRCAPVDYDPGATCPTFRAFLDRIMPEAEEQNFLQRYFGYALTGETSEQKLLLCHGEGSNGKSTLLNALLNVFGLGEYAVTIAFESLLQDDRRRGDAATPDLAKLPGARFVAAVEPQENARLSTAMIKRFTGSEPMKVRDLHKDFVEFRPQFKAALFFNPKPAVTGQDHGTWRRIMMMEFRQNITDAEKDKNLEPMLAAETSGILNWLLDGYREWREKGLREPDSVIRATGEYRDENDPAGQFINENICHAPGKSTPAKDILARLRKWCEERNMRNPISQRRLGDRMKQLGFAKSDSGPGRTFLYHDIELAPPDPRDGPRGFWGPSGEDV